MDRMDEEEKMLLSYDPVPGYRTAFHIVLIVAAIYLGIIFLRTLN
jgi:hypothetical protein